ncbi:AAA family ATPase (plasmid) [Paenibacillus rhizovicinus]|uniref:AAA family ATPase n=1 Tax=Paenibacillus rhizovicinus TaxID=2704463 RepID=A0A6C0PAA4_9BACL|nr:ATP-binding protein [Paenibacillus rhizovicinus]QHW35468.1 AAA family ATPase [Paenibacillus rhizovicinus]
MNVLSTEISGFKLHRSMRSFTFGKVNRIGGGNRKGKTTISEAIAWCFYGCDLTGKTKEVFDRLKNTQAKETKVRIDVELPQRDGSIVLFEFCRIRKGKVTSLFLDGQASKQAEFDSLLGPMEPFLSIFIPGYFGTIAVSEPAKARNMLVSSFRSLIKRTSLRS